MSEKRKSFKAGIRPARYGNEFDLWFTTNGFQSYSHSFLLGELEELHAVIGKHLEATANGATVESVSQ